MAGNYLDCCNWCPAIAYNASKMQAWMCGAPILGECGERVFYGRDANPRRSQWGRGGPATIQSGLDSEFRL